MPAEKVTCPLHELFQSRIDEVEKTQKGRNCGHQDATIKAHEKEINAIVKDNDDQWTAINQLRRTVWGWAPVMSFLGSAIGAVLVSYLMSLKK